MGQTTSTEPGQDDSTLSRTPVSTKFSVSLPPGLGTEEKKLRYEKEISRLMDNWPDGGQDKFRADYRGMEKADLSEPTPAYKELSFDSQQVIYQVPKEGQPQRNFKKVMRSKGDVWRKHGSLKRICEVGGKAFSGPPGGKPKYFDIRPGSTPPPDPAAKPLTEIDDYRPFGGVSGLSAE